jgi:hypothetical protein
MTSCTAPDCNHPSTPDAGPFPLADAGPAGNNCTLLATCCQTIQASSLKAACLQAYANVTPNDQSCAAILGSFRSAQLCP